MKRIVGIVYVFLCWGISLHAQSVRVIETLKKLEMENISVVEKSDTITAAFETSVYRGAYNGIGIAIRHLVAMPEMPTLQLVILDNALPQLCITLPAKLVQQYQSGALLGEWEKTTPLPFYSLGEPTLTKITNKGGEEFFVLKMLISNNSDYDGIIHMDIRKDGWWYQPLEDPRAKTKIEMPAHTSKEFVSVWEDQIRNVEINTMVSGNLPNIISQDINNVKQERNKIVKDSIYILPESSFDLPGEIIVDNEDSTLFILSAPPIVGLLPKWLDEVEETPFKYSGISWWRPPLQWTATTNDRYYGKYIRSAFVIKSGDGSQTATWKVPVPEVGQYDLYYHVFKDDELRWNNNLQGEYHFKVKYGR